MNDELTYISCLLAKEGYFGGDPEKIFNAPVDVVCDMIAVNNTHNKIEQYQMARAREKS